MTLVHDPPPRPLTVGEYAVLPANVSGYTELVEGRPVLSPSPGVRHDLAIHELFVQLRTQVPEHLEVSRELPVDLRLAAADGPGFVRRPDLMVAGSGSASSARESGRLLHADEVLLAIEITTRESVRTDYVSKRGEYAEADIPYYWLVDIAESVSLLAYETAAGLGYVDAGEYRGEVVTNDPIDVRVRLDELV